MSHIYKKMIPLAKYSTILGSSIYIAIVLILGLMQPGYNHFIDTMSVLVLGKWGWIQNVNFAVLAVTIALFGIGLSIYLENKMITLTSFFFCSLACAVVVLIFLPADAVDRTHIQLVSLNSLHGLIHLITTMGIVAFTIPLVAHITRHMKKHVHFHSYVRYTLISFIINIIAGILWFIFRRYGILFEWKGIWQKLMAVNVLSWMVVLSRQFTVEGKQNAHSTN